ncbi:beta-ketoacyl synthase N-terminal-like domain-containing protein [Amycolatopsis sp. CA-230715]|uniref:beta-ketoacyl synthase N-terminal-like domain-containing protein n=1 Tax=Amycolatopsis sp. CA-230715 TaxID=2745196 RepID=UPI001C01F702|nr:beta-ketoacyl synthase N-terminal-like domain-containing protein [Amycolatopsis sp. CA-230715]QWF78773.1 hypothetical protein HUW46_02171 [Amycolatopsis sp. CA-230715]
MNIHPDGPPVITAWSAISPFGYGHNAFTNGFATGASTVDAVDEERWQVTGECAALVPDFDVRTLLGAKGTRSMNRVTGLAVVTAGQLLAQVPGRGDEFAEGTGLVLGTTTGSPESMMGFTRASLVGERPDHVEPAAVPSCVMNCAAGQVAIWHQLKGPNATVAAGRRTGLVGLNYARRLLATGRARMVLCGAAEEYSTARAKVERVAQDGTPGPALGEGCVMVLLEPAANAIARGSAPLASLLAVESATCVGGNRAQAVRDAVSRTLHRAGVSQGEVSVAAGTTAGDDERNALSDLFGDRADTAAAHDLIGDTASVSALFQLATVLGAERNENGLAVITALDDDGAISTALLKLHPATTAQVTEAREPALAGGVR